MRAAGWYQDPNGEPLLRWWDGEHWTELLHDPQTGPTPGRERPRRAPTAPPTPPQTWRSKISGRTGRPDSPGDRHPPTGTRPVTATPPGTGPTPPAAVPQRPAPPPGGHASDDGYGSAAGFVSAAPYPHAAGPAPRRRPEWLAELHEVVIERRTELLVVTTVAFLAAVASVVVPVLLDNGTQDISSPLGIDTVLPATWRDQGVRDSDLGAEQLWLNESDAGTTAPGTESGLVLFRIEEPAARMYGSGTDTPATTQAWADAVADAHDGTPGEITDLDEEDVRIGYGFVETAGVTLLVFTAVTEGVVYAGAAVGERAALQTIVDELSVTTARRPGNVRRIKDWDELFSAYANPFDRAAG